MAGRRDRKIEEREILFFRVEDEHSQTQKTDEGILARDMNSGLTFESRSSNNWTRIEEILPQHCDHLSREASPFISAYGDAEAAIREACRRSELGRQDVSIIVIDGSKDQGMQYRYLDSLKKKLVLQIPDAGLHHSECFFLHRIPAKSVLRSLKL